VANPSPDVEATSERVRAFWAERAGRQALAGSVDRMLGVPPSFAAAAGA
jgi:hypothetical protein